MLMHLNNLNKDVLGPVKVWLVGSSIVKHAFAVARSEQGGLQLGLENLDIWWQGYSGMNLRDVVPKLRTLKEIGDKPDIILLHCGGNSLGRTPLKIIRELIDDVVRFINENFSCTIIWSEILPRSSWRYSSNIQAMETARRRVNSYAATRIIANKGCYIKHNDLREVTPLYYMEDGVHLTRQGNCLFLDRLSVALHAYINRNVQYLSSI